MEQGEGRFKASILYATYMNNILFWGGKRRVVSTDQYQEWWQNYFLVCDNNQTPLTYSEKKQQICAFKRPISKIL